MARSMEHWDSCVPARIRSATSPSLLSILIVFVVTVATRRFSSAFSVTQNGHVCLPQPGRLLPR